ncbi:MAG: alkaline shock response membrane anchor protein AmaP [Bacillota bacterium]|nr:alkaline shock response membrane anchor protein AmaP [Bacillota bacterium]
MRWVDRAISVLVALVFLGGGGALLAMALGWWRPEWDWQDLLRLAAGERRGQVLLAGAAALLLGVYFFALGTRRRSQERALVKETSLGMVRISLRAIEALVKRAARQVQGIREVETALNSTPEGLEVTLTVNVLPDTRIPEMADQVQTTVSRYIYDTVGVNVARVLVNVRNVAGESKSRLE